MAFPLLLIRLGNVPAVTPGGYVSMLAPWIGGVGSVGDAVEPEVPDTGIGAGETVLVPGPRARYYTREELEALLQTLLRETEGITGRKVDKRKRPEAVIKAVKRSLGKERVQVSKLRELAVVWNEGAAMVRRHADAERRENELHIAVVLEAYFRRMAWLRDEDDIATLLALGEL